VRELTRGPADGDVTMLTSRTVCFALCVVGGLATIRAQSPVNLSGKVNDTVGAVIPRAFVVVHPDKEGLLPPSDTREAQMLSSDIDGAFTAEVKPGFYDVCVMSSSYIPECRKVNVKKEKDLKLRFVLRISPQVSDALADRVP
jgi:hypothetical protein